MTVAVDAGLMAAADRRLGLETNAKWRALRLSIHRPDHHVGDDCDTMTVKLLRDLDKAIAALQAAEERGAERMRERVLADLSAYIGRAEGHIAASRHERQDLALLEERVMALDAARSRIRALPTDKET